MIYTIFPDEIDTILLTGTSRIIANPIAKSLGVSRLIATEPEIEDGYFTGRIDVKLKKLTSKDEGKTKASIAQDLSQPWVVQLGAFGKYDNAKRLKNMIKNPNKNSKNNKLPMKCYYNSCFESNQDRVVNATNLGRTLVHPAAPSLVTFYTEIVSIKLHFCVFNFLYIFFKILDFECQT